MRQPAQIQAEIIRVLAERGWAGRQAPPAVYQSVQREVLTALELAEGATKAVGAVVRERLGRTVALHVLQENEATCASNECGMHRVLEGGVEACDGCTCNATLLDTKRKDPKSHCPDKVPGTSRYRWDNRGKPLAAGTASKGGGDAVRKP